MCMCTCVSMHACNCHSIACSVSICYSVLSTHDVCASPTYFWFSSVGAEHPMSGSWQRRTGWWTVVSAPLWGEGLPPLCRCHHHSLHASSM